MTENRDLLRYIHAAIPACAVAGVALLYYALFKQLDVGAGLDSRSLTAEQALIEKYRLLWGATAFAVVAALICNIVGALMMLQATLADQSPRTRILVLVEIGVVSIASFLGLRYGDAAGPFADSLLAGINGRTKVDVGLLTLFGNHLAAIAVCLLVGALTTLALPARADSIDKLAPAIRMWLLSLYGASSLLAFGVLEVWALYRWGAAVIPVAPAAVAAAAAGLSPIGSVADAIALAAGIVFTVLLVAIYVPVAVLHERWLNQLVAERARNYRKLEVDKWLAQWGLKSSPVSVGTALALPIVAFVLTVLIKQALGGV